MSNFVRPQSSLTLDGARAVLAAAFTKAQQMGVPVNVAVADPGGHLLAFERHEGAAVMSGQVAQDKAYTVAILGGAPTHVFFDVIKDDPAVREGIVHQNRLIAFGGGVPVTVDGQFVGSVGVSGGTAEQDREIAEAGAAAIG